MKTFLTILFSACVSVASAQLKPTDSGSKVKFVIRNFGINTGGTFHGLAGSINYDPANPTAANFNVSVDASTVDTDIESRDNHLRKEEYLYVEKYPRIEFRSTRVTKTNSPDYLYMFGVITIRGVSQEVKFPFKSIAQDGGYLFTGKFTLNRRDFGVGGSSMSLADDLNVELSVFAK